MTPGPAVLAIGYVTTDLLLKVNRFPDADEEIPILSFGEYPGGSAANTAVGVRRLGVSAALLACIGDDERGRRGLEALAADGVETSRIVTTPTGPVSSYVVGAVDARGERQLYTYRGASGELSPDHLAPESLRGITHVHICTMPPDFAERGLVLARDADSPLRVSMDPGTLGCAGEYAPRLRQILPRLDLLFLNAVELRLLLGITDVRSLPDYAGALPPRVAVKLGAQGCVLYRRGSRLTTAPALPVDTVDTTGAGDAFAAGYLVGWIRGLEDADLALFSNAVAALSTRAHGCRDGLPTAPQVAAFLRGRGVAIPEVGLRG